MTVASETNRSGPYNGNGSTTVFDYDFRILDVAHVQVIIADDENNETTLELTTDYTVDGVGNAGGGSVTLGTAPATGQTITILRNVPFVQETDLQNQGAYYAEDIEAALDLAAMRDQQLEEKMNRAVLLPASSEDSGGQLAAQLAADITRLAQSADEVDTVASIRTDVETVSGIAGDVALLADVSPVLSGVASAVAMDEKIFVGDGVTTEWVLDREPGVRQNVLVWVGGAIQDTADYSVLGATLTISPPVADGIEIRTLTMTLVSSSEVEQVADQAQELLSQASAFASFNYESVTSVSAANIAPLVDYINVFGYDEAGDGGGGVYRRSAFEPDHDGKVQSADGSWWELYTDKPDVKQFGAPLDGANDFVPSLNLAMDYAEAKGLPAVYISVPASGSEYRIETTIFMRSGLDVIVEKGVVFDANSMAATVIRWQGSFGPELNMNSLRNRGSRNISFASAHSASVGDFFLMISQRNALSVDAGEWQLGVGTAGSDYAYLCEWIEVARVTSTVTVDTTTGRIFTNYYNAATADPNSLRARTTLRKASPVINSNWYGGEFLVNCPSAVVAVMDCAVRCVMKGATFYRKARFGSTCRFEVCFECYFEECINFNDVELVWDYNTYHGKLNRFVASGGSMDCVFLRCKDYWGAQSFDLAYYGAEVTTAGYPLVVVRPRVVECQTFGCFEASTSHPGVWNERWQENNFTDCHVGGLLIRGLTPYVHGNVIDSISELRPNTFETGYQSCGIMLYGGFAKNAAVEGNQISGFRKAFLISDAPSTEGYFSEVNASIEGNSVDRCYVGLETVFANPAPYAGNRGICYTDNAHTRMQVGMVYLASFTAGTIIEDNLINGKLINEAVEAGDLFIIEAEANNPGLVIVNNRWLRPAGETEFGGNRPWMVYVRGATNTTAFPAAVWQNRSLIKDNYVNIRPSTELIFVSDNPYNQVVGGVAS